MSQSHPVTPKLPRRVNRKAREARWARQAGVPELHTSRDLLLHNPAPLNIAPIGNDKSNHFSITGPGGENPEKAISVVAVTDSAAQVQGKSTGDEPLSVTEAVRQGVDGSNGLESATTSSEQCSILFVLVVAVDEAAHDHEVLQRAFGPPTLGGTYVARILGQVTFESLKAEVKQLYDECTKTSGSELFILLTGHGDKSNRMILSNQEFIDETDLFGLLRELQETDPKLIPVTILFDICRESQQPSADTIEGVSLIWTCSPGEYAHALRLPYGPDIPSSCFLLALMMGPRTPGITYTEESLKNRVKEQLDQLVKYLKEVHSSRHSKEGICPICSKSNK
ncbi:unnamed protein product [Rhizoctonia solani]|uniref:Uncharacterized protein n=1 Tax=Rhizoctonia solani TaxID=456999 RepID=A0A8H3HV18_9AGAM|nr:unnamed protein product [Rhizoctonia solani]